MRPRDRKRAMSPEKQEALKAHNATQEYHGRCRVCGATWTGLRAEMPRQCPSCGHPHGS